MNELVTQRLRVTQRNYEILRVTIRLVSLSTDGRILVRVFGPLVFTEISRPLEYLGTEIARMSLIQVDTAIVKFEDVRSHEDFVAFGTWTDLLSFVSLPWSSRSSRL